jgi:hypothetical protein
MMSEPTLLINILLADLAALDVIPFDRATQVVLAAVAGCVTLGAVACYASRQGRPLVRHGWIAWLMYGAFLATVGVLAVTSLQAVLSGQALSGYALMGHVSAAGAFTFLLVAVAWLFLPAADIDGDFQREHRWWFARWSSWLLILSALATAGTMFLSMLPLLDTAGLHQVLSVHRFAGLATVAAAVLHAFALAMTRFGFR